MVFQSFALFPWKTVLDNVGFGPKMRGVPKAERDRIAHEYLALANLSHAADRYPNELSGGMQQRVGVVRALANNPEVLLMDEPFASVDAQTRMTLQEELTRIWQERRPTVIFITHDVAEAVFLANRVVVLSKGRVLEQIEVAAAAAASLGQPDGGRDVQAAVGPCPADGALGVSIASEIAGSSRARFILGVVAAWLLFQLWLTLAAPGKLSAELDGTSPKVNVQIELPFTPERFHVLRISAIWKGLRRGRPFDRITWRQTNGSQRGGPALLGDERWADKRGRIG